ncbi:hypothetical protein FJV41_39585 [Myxococcus llanfairpwllgwyngyllgogerychwyrndrobwllllantysiliogogogochensis]|uniref:Uncharacterized protein n=1 Tax=Myxococcus llanfairpwllgwyngyllgogerychwyrndrobwllllantysiliogogogochensis TaxID=2590453 RepID=A0A540WN28_9BACT|nr:hypothetical protein [Myxococcus llanfairpwllgwyngyllgogerychwyrndrobwllllantysiliogogogochensis]TQF10405.1 hypothetical protein FJV41_39585 [Myxococcus llanfairpwllgwyngyllgogerychwyrndrobwllllantysiliogogogochensis]
MKTLLLTSLLATALLTRCRAPDGCAPVSTRCAGNVAEICNADSNWQVLADCDAVSEHSSVAFTCAYVSEDGITGHTCMPATVDAGTADAGAEEGGVL